MELSAAGTELQRNIQVAPARFDYVTGRL